MTTTETRRVHNATRHEVTEHLPHRPHRITAWLHRDGDGAAHVVETMDLLAARPTWRKAHRGA